MTATTGSELVAIARAEVGAEPGVVVARDLAAAADARTVELIARFVHANGPPPARFAWVALGSHARGELHCASDQDHALLWAGDQVAESAYARDLAAEVIAGLEQFGMQRCHGGYMADRWSRSLESWVTMLHEHLAAPTPQAVLDTDIFLDLRPLAGDLDVTPVVAMLRAGADSPRLLQGLARAAESFPVPLHAFGRLPRVVDLKRGGLAPLVLLARLYGLQAQSQAVATVDRLNAAETAGILSSPVVEGLVAAFELLVGQRLRNQVGQIDAGEPLSDRVVTAELGNEQQDQLRQAFRAIKSAQSVAALTHRTDL